MTEIKNETIGIIAGSGFLPEELIRKSGQKSLKIFVLGFEDITTPGILADNDHAVIPLGAIAKGIKHLKSRNIKHLVLAGRVGRPDMRNIGLDRGGLRLLATLKKLQATGDDIVFRTIISFLEKSGFVLHTIPEIWPELAMPQGNLTKTEIKPKDESDIKLGSELAKEMGRMDIGQSVIIQNGQILGVEAAEGTDELIRRCKYYRTATPGGVLVKRLKPNQDMRVDLPAIGVKTVELVHESGLRGIAADAGYTLIIDKNAVIKRAEELGCFLIGIKP